MNQRQRTEVYCSLVACPVCNAKEGERCMGRHGRRTVSYHYTRATLLAKKRRTDPDFRARYETVRKKVLDASFVTCGRCVEGDELFY